MAIHRHTHPINMFFYQRKSGGQAQASVKLIFTAAGADEAAGGEDGLEVHGLKDEAGVNTNSLMRF